MNPLSQAFQVVYKWPFSVLDAIPRTPITIQTMSMKLSTIPQAFSADIEDRLGYLHMFDTVFLVDDSASMTKYDNEQPGEVCAEAVQH